MSEKAQKFANAVEEFVKETIKREKTNTGHALGMAWNPNSYYDALKRSEQASKDKLVKAAEEVFND